MGREKFILCMAEIARSYSGCNFIISIVSRESTAVTPHPLKLRLLYVSGYEVVEGIERSHLSMLRLDIGRSSSLGKANCS